MSEAPLGMTVPQWTLADRIRKAREHAGLTRVELALTSGISRSSIDNYETGKTTPLALHLKAVADATAVPLAWLRFGVSPGEGGDGSSAAEYEQWSRMSRMPLSLAVAA